MAKKLNVYLDNNATTEVSNDVAVTVIDLILNDVFGNPSSNHSAGVQVAEVINSSRKSVAKSLGCFPEEVIFTSGGTESNNLALRSVFIQDFNNPSEIVISAGEHSSVKITSELVAGTDYIRYIPLKADGSLDLEWADRVITEDTGLVSVMLANNETGVIFPVKEIVKIAHRKNVLVHCDAVQAYGKIPIDVKDLGVDLLSISGHKAHALSGVGALYVRRGLLMYPQITGGSQEGGVRAGTENYIGIASLGVAAEEIMDTGCVKPYFRDLFEAALLKRVPDIKINGLSAERVPNTSSITFNGVHSGSLLALLDQQNVYASSGSACSSGFIYPSKVLTSMGLSEEEALSTARFSFSKLTTIEQMPVAIEVVCKSVSALRKNLLGSN